MAVWLYTVYMDYRATIEKIRFSYLKGEIDLDEARAKVMPLLKEMNAKGEKIAKEHGRKFRPFTFGYIFR
jgi:hypothetical protein